MKRTDRNPAIGRAAAAAALAVLLAACGKDVRVSGGGGLVDEERLSASPSAENAPREPSAGAWVREGLPRWTRRLAAWTPSRVERNSEGAAYTDLLSVAERAAIPAAGVSAAAGLRPSYAHEVGSYPREAPYTRIDPDYGALWREYADALGEGTQEEISSILYWANSGVSQSSREGASGRSGDKVHAEVGWSGDRPTFRVGLRRVEEDGSLMDWSLDSEWPGQSGSYFTRWTEPYGPAHGGRFRSGVSGGGNMTLVVRTDRTGAEDTDWLATGMWWSRTTSAPHESFGVFADGGDPVKYQPDLQRLTGTATYTGDSHGVFSYADADDRRNIPFQGSAALTADFGDASAYGSVSGSIHDMKWGGGPVPIPGAPRITLGGHRVSASWERRGTFKGPASMTYAGESYSGKWGGQFFGNAAAGAAGADAHPSSAAGTFGVAADAGHSFVGTFEVHR